MRYFLDTEFIENGKTIDLISIGIVSDDGREFYRCNQEADLSKADEWVQKNVIVHLPGKCSPLWATRTQIRDELSSFLFRARPVEMWAYYADYDWVALCQLFGRMLDLPDWMPMYCNDIKQVFEQMGGKAKIGHLKPPDPVDCHDALADARWNKTFYDALVAHGRLA